MLVVVGFCGFRYFFLLVSFSVWGGMCLLLLFAVCVVCFVMLCVCAVFFPRVFFPSCVCYFLFLDVFGGICSALFFSVRVAMPCCYVCVLVGFFIINLFLLLLCLSLIVADVVCLFCCFSCVGCFGC